MLNQTKKPLLGSIMLLLCAILWGFAFTAQSTAVEQMNSVSFNGIRYALATVVVFLLVIVFDFVSKKRGVKPTGFNRETIVGGIICGIALLLASDLQQLGIISHTPAGKASFITVLYVVIVPMLSLLLRKKPTVLCRFAIVIALLGFYFMCIRDDFTLTAGDALVLMCAIAYSFQMTFIDFYSQDTDPLKLTLVQFLTCTVISLPLMGIFGFPTTQHVGDAIIALLYVGVMSAGLGITFQTIGQKHTDPSPATLLMSLESVFGLLGAMIILGETHTTRELIGCLLVFVAVCLAELSFPRKLLQFEKNNFAITGKPNLLETVYDKITERLHKSDKLSK